MEVTIQRVQIHIRNAMERLAPLSRIANSPMVQFITGDLWKQNVPEEIQREIQTASDIDSAIRIFWTHLDVDSGIKRDPLDKFQHFRAFLSSSRQDHLDNLNDVWITPERLKSIFDLQRKKPLPIRGFMSTKKNHEVQITAELIANMCASSRNEEPLCVIDAGDGKGYLSSRLSLEHNIKVLGVDCNPVNTLGAMLRSEKLERLWTSMKSQAETVAANGAPSEKQSRRKRREKREAAKDKNLAKEQAPNVNTNYKNATHFITPRTDFMKLFSEHFDMRTDEIGGFCLSGLHTCGSLAPSCLRIYNENDQIMGICNIGCCYHLLEEQFSTFVYRSIRRERSPESKLRQVCEVTEEAIDKSYGFPMSKYLIDTEAKLGRNARMLACQSVHRVVDKQELPNGHLFFRSLLEALIQLKQPEYLDRIEVGRIKQCETFVEYVRKATKRNPVLNFDNISDQELSEFYDEHRDDKLRLDVYHLMRVSVAAIVESIILLDRFLYLKEHERPNDTSYLVRLFDPVVSPRCYGLIAMKQFQKD